MQHVHTTSIQKKGKLLRVLKRDIFLVQSSLGASFSSFDVCVLFLAERRKGKNAYTRNQNALDMVRAKFTFTNKTKIWDDQTVRNAFPENESTERAFERTF